MDDKKSFSMYCCFSISPLGQAETWPGKKADDPILHGDWYANVIIIIVDN